MYLEKKHYGFTFSIPYFVGKGDQWDARIFGKETCKQAYIK